MSRKRRRRPSQKSVRACSHYGFEQALVLQRARDFISGCANFRSYAEDRSQPVDFLSFRLGTCIAHSQYDWASRPIGEERDMNWDRIEGNWKQLTGKVKEQWGKLTDDQIDTIAGKRDQLAGKIQESYGITKDEAERQIDTFAESYGDYEADDVSRDLRGRH